MLELIEGFEFQLSMTDEIYHFVVLKGQRFGELSQPLPTENIIQFLFGFSNFSVHVFWEFSGLGKAMVKISDNIEQAKYWLVLCYQYLAAAFLSQGGLGVSSLRVLHDL